MGHGTETETETGDVVDAAPDDALDGDARTLAEAEARLELRALVRRLDRANVVALVTAALLRDPPRRAANVDPVEVRAAHLARLASALCLDLGAADIDLMNGVDDLDAVYLAPGGDA